MLALLLFAFYKYAGVLVHAYKLMMLYILLNGYLDYPVIINTPIVLT